MLKISVSLAAFLDEIEDEVIINQDVLARYDKLVSMTETKSVGDVTAQDIHPLGGTVVRIHADADTDPGRPLEYPPFRLVHQSRGDTATPESGQYAQVIDFRDSFFNKRRIFRLPLDSHVTGDIFFIVRDEDLSFTALLLCVKVLEVFRRGIPGATGKRGSDGRDFSRLKQFNINRHDDYSQIHVLSENKGSGRNTSRGKSNGL